MSAYFLVDDEIAKQENFLLILNRGVGFEDLNYQVDALAQPLYSLSLLAYNQLVQPLYVFFILFGNLDLPLWF